MSAAEDMRTLLAPLGVYRLDGIFNGSELEAAGTALDGVLEKMEEIERESCPLTAESWGLEKLAGLFASRPAADTPRHMGEAIAALLRIGGDSFTLKAINDTLQGCGLPAHAEEYGVGQVGITFPGVPGIPPNLGDLQHIIEDILPPHVQIIYQFWYLTWRELEQKYPSWKTLENTGLTWDEL